MIFPTCFFNFFPFSRYSWYIFMAIVTSSLMFFTSATAHLMHQKSHYAHMGCFLCDLGSICFNTFFFALMQISTCSPIWYFKMLEPYLIHTLGLHCAIGGIMILIAQTGFKRPYPLLKRLLQFGPTGVLWVFTMFPLVVPFIWDDTNENERLNINYHNHVVYTVLFVFGICLLTFDVPQRYCPGRLDFLGQGHHIFHVCGFTANFLQINACYTDYLANRDVIARSRIPPTLFFCVSTFVTLLIFHIYIIRRFYKLIGHNFDENGSPVLMYSKNE